MTVRVNDLSKYQLSFRKADLLALPLSIHDAFEEISESNALCVIYQRLLLEIAESRINMHGGFNVGYVLMILPQVHLRKPCYDFYFL
jgi:hypothetical protein